MILEILNVQLTSLEARCEVTCSKNAKYRSDDACITRRTCYAADELITGFITSPYRGGKQTSNPCSRHNARSTVTRAQPVRVGNRPHAAVSISKQNFSTVLHRLGLIITSVNFKKDIRLKYKPANINGWNIQTVDE